VGLRPTKGRVSNRGSVPVAYSFDTIGPLARRAEDVAAVLGAIAGYDRGDPVCEDVPVEDYVGELGRGPQAVRVGVLGASFREAPLTAATATVLDEATARLAELGLRIDEVVLPGHLTAVDMTADLLLAEAAAFHEQRLAQRPDGFAPDVQARLRRGAAVTGPQYGAGRQAQRRWRREVLEAFDDHDILLAPGCPFPAPLISESDPLAMTGLLAHFTSVWVLAGTPAMVVPAGFVDGLPVAMQLIGRPSTTNAATGHRISPSRTTTSRCGPTTRRGCSTRSGSSVRTSTGPRWAEWWRSSWPASIRTACSRW
jgi:aspartyl-tRNA(Asn)/glutamyl-tRNA(Gln) amidotransferase subunit A